MSNRKANVYTILYASLFLLGGALHSVERVVYMTWDTAIFLVALTIYTAMVLGWLQSIRVRLLPTAGRRYILWSAVLMLFFLLARTIRFRIVEDTDVPFLQMMWYVYYVPLLFVPTLFLMMCVEADKTHGSPHKQLNVHWLLLIPTLLFVMVCTNNLHHWVFVPLIDGPLLGYNSTYIYGWGYYLLCFVSVSEAVVGMGFLVGVTRKTYNWVRAMYPLVMVLLYVAFLAGNTYFNIYLTNADVRILPYTAPEIAVFGMMAVFESCIRIRLLPHNEHYADIFGGLQIPAFITDRTYKVRWHTAVVLQATEAQLTAATTAPVYLDADTRLGSMPLNTAGYVFFAEDESDLHALDRQLEEAGRTIAAETALERQENELRVQKAHIEARQHIYDHVNAVMYPKQQAMRELLSRAVPGSEGYRAVVAEVLVRAAYVKRGTNMLLMLQEADHIALTEIQLAMQESIHYMKYCGIQAVANIGGEDTLKGDVAFALYTTFEDIVEALLGHCTRLLVYMDSEVMRISANCATTPVLPDAPIPFRLRREDGGCYFTIRHTGGKSDD